MNKHWQFTSLGELKKRARRNKVELITLLFILGLAAFFRLWRLEETQYFTYDQARDFLIVKRIIVDRKLTLIGPTVLIPGVYLPPLYYYSLVPALFIFNFHLLGPDIYTALLGVGAVFVFYLLSKELFGKLVASLTSLVFATLPMLVATSRQAWNPNTTCLFSLLFIFFIWKFLKERRWFWLYGASAVLGWGLNLHYSMIVLMPFLFLTFAWNAKKSYKFPLKPLFNLVILILFLSPLFLFELRHGFSISKNILTFFHQQSGESQAFISRFSRVLVDVFKMPFVLLAGHLIPGVESVKPSHIVLLDQLPIFSLKLSPWQDFYFWFSLLITALIFITGVAAIVFQKDKKGLFLVFSWLVLGTAIRLIIPLGSFYFYTYTFLFPAGLLLLANLIHVLTKWKRGIVIVWIIIIIFLISGLRELFSLPTSKRSENYFQEAVTVIADDYFSQEPFDYVVAANNADPQRWDHNGLEYRYFLEALHALPRSGWEAADYQRAEALYLVDEGGLSDPLVLGGMEMESFKPTQVEKTWRLSNGDKVYKLVRD